MTYPISFFAKPTHPNVSLISTQPLQNKLWVSVTYPTSFLPSLLTLMFLLFNSTQPLQNKCGCQWHTLYLFSEPTHSYVSPYFYSTFTEQVVGVSDIPFIIFWLSLLTSMFLSISTHPSQNKLRVSVTYPSSFSSEPIHPNISLPFFLLNLYRTSFGCMTVMQHNTASHIIAYTTGVEYFTRQLCHSQATNNVLLGTLSLHTSPTKLSPSLIFD